MINGNTSHWWTQLGIPTPRAALPGPTDVDVAIVGAGYTGLWTAFYLKRADPSLRIAVLEQRFAGFGASGAERRLAGEQHHRWPRAVCQQPRP